MLFMEEVSFHLRHPCIPLRAFRILIPTPFDVSHDMLFVDGYITHVVYYKIKHIL